MPTFEWSPGEQEHYRRLFQVLADHLDEKATRLLGAAMAWSLGQGSHAAIHALTGLAMDTLQFGVAQLQGDEVLPPDRVRRPGGGRKPITDIYPALVPALLQLVGEDNQGDPESPLLWTTKSLSHLADALTQQGMPVSTTTVCRLLAEAGYSMQANRKRFDRGSDHPDTAATDDEKPPEIPPEAVFISTLDTRAEYAPSTGALCLVSSAPPSQSTQPARVGVVLGAGMVYGACAQTATARHRGTVSGEPDAVILHVRF